MATRYVIDGPRTQANTWFAGMATITTATASLRDTRSGSVYREGAYRVRIERKPALPNQPRTKTFKGETAWSHAEMYAYDARGWFNRNDYDVAV